MPFDPYRNPADPDAEPMPDNAQDVLDSIALVRVHAETILRMMEDLDGILDRKADAVLDDAHGYQLSHVKAWDKLADAASGAAAAVLQLVAEARRA